MTDPKVSEKEIRVLEEMKKSYLRDLKQEENELYSELSPFDKATTEKYLQKNRENQAELEPTIQAIRAAIERGQPEVDWPTIICLCGSTRFMDAFFDAGWAETLAGKIVLSVGVCKHFKDHGGEALGPEAIRLLDELHLRKIDLADEVLILNVGGYIGESTRNELEYAKRKGKQIRFLEPIHDFEEKK